MPCPSLALQAALVTYLEQPYGKRAVILAPSMTAQMLHICGIGGSWHLHTRRDQINTRRCELTGNAAEL